MLERAYVMITCESGCEQRVAEQLKSLDGIKEIASTIGAYDIVAKIEVPTTEALRELIARGIRKISRVHATTTIVCEPYF
ncbi:MAG: Lrp/AsnC ligand binding domain-containing protein [Thaumarchaeota archaeon]|nr:Lrp/AsnC ligand binding domain-containing protein [Nitrososphaerota archaeon]MDE1868099.1 Lrp/AsnC ligand binding domain-containing protein [Nitrososphaerota archaeon]